MKTVTDRIANQNIIAIAKQQYEQTKRNTIPCEIVSLPSAGKIYPENHPLRSGQIEMRYMTAYDEDILTNALKVYPGLGISATQLGIKKRACIVKLEPYDYELFLVNPIIKETGLVGDSSISNAAASIATAGLMRFELYGPVYLPILEYLQRFL